jgi:ABC-2 type transport system ATP-binding protein
MSDAAGSAIQVSALTKRYGDLAAVDSVDLTVQRGTVFSLLGPNGAGKTTMVSMLSTLLEPTSGSATVAGADVTKDPSDVRRRIGITFQETVLDDDLTGRQSLEFHGQLYGMGKGAIKARADELLELTELTEASKRQVKTYSGGMKRRLELARGLMTEPEVLFLDEPTLGVDHQNRAAIGEYVLGLRASRGLTVFLTTHYMDEAERLSDQVAIIDQGRIVTQGSPVALIESMGTDSMLVRGSGDLQAFSDTVQRMPFVEEVCPGEGYVQIGLDSGSRRMVDIVSSASTSGYAIEDITVSKPSLGDVFLKHTGSELRD